MDTTSPVVKQIARKVLPSLIRDALGRTIYKCGKRKIARRLADLQRRACSGESGAGETERLLDYTIRINSWDNFYTLYKEVFVKRIYHFTAERSDPLILDCGSNIGAVILYMKHLYPQARIVGFEPDPALFPWLQENLNLNGVKDVRVIQAALSAREGTLTFYSDGNYGSCLAQHLPADVDPQKWIRSDVPCVRLRDYLTESVDFLKMNIESAEWEVLADSEDRLPLVREMVIEYHHFPGIPRTLHKILELLDRQGFDYLINDFCDWDALQPPFGLTPDSRYCLLVYAKRVHSN
jgi:FkbM family methyltransferase